MRNLFKLMLCLLLANISSAFCMTAIDVARDADRFYPVLNKTMYIPDFKIVKSEVTKYSTGIQRIIKVPMSILIDRLNFKKDEAISVVNFDEKLTFKYVLKGYAYLLVFSTKEFDNISNVSLILSDDQRIHKDLSTGLLKRNKMNGFAYKGSELILKPFNIEKIPVKDVSKKDPIYTLESIKISKPNIVKEAMIFNYRIVVYTPVVESDGVNSNEFFFVKPDGMYAGLRRESYLLDAKNENILAYDVFQDTKVFRAFEEINHSEQPQVYIVICSKTEIKRLDIGSGVIDRDDDL